ncbi:MAG: type 2 isopentenyl-diphosphate Delta-isomerase [Polyangiaceae bacterium]|nr:type 2 isopentenyl-diphosphate Delta-isomerase [Polyangiaceae bacterium]
MSDITQRKSDHLDLAIHGDVSFRDQTTLLECVRLAHDALPDLDSSAIDLSTEILGKRLRAPILIAGMTGGHARAEAINRELAAIAELRGLAFGLGSQRAMVVCPETRPSFMVRDVMPTALLLGNIGLVQARSMSDQAVADLVGAVGADALCVHLNPAMEMVQDDGDRDFGRGLERIGELVERLPVPVVVKETGCGLSARVGSRLRGVGVRHADVSGAGGTSWVAVETLRASTARRGLGEAFWDWGIPTAASVALLAPLGFDTLFATGGLSTGLDVARAIALGASAGGIARHLLRALDAGGPEGARAYLGAVEDELRTAMLLTGCRGLGDLRTAPRVILGELAEWLRQVASGA